MTGFDKLKQFVLDTQGDVDKAEKGNKAAKTRVRSAMQKIKSIAQEVRVEVKNLL